MLTHTTSKAGERTQETNSESQARCQLDSIREMVAELNAANHPETDNLDQYDSALDAITNDALSVEVRSGWYTMGREADTAPAEFCILLCTGGPAVRMIGALEFGEPSSARLEHQDWGTPWTEYHPANAEQDVLMAYARCFYFGA